MTPTPPVQPPTPESGGYLRNKDIIVISLSDWEGPKRIRQYLSEELTRRGNRVLFVESQYTLSKFLKNPNFPRLLRFLKGPRAFRENLFAISTVPFIPGGEFSSFISGVNWNFERTFLRSALKRLGFNNPLLWIFAYNAASIIGKLGESRTLYFCNDAFSLLVESPRLQDRVAALEKQLMANVSTVFTVSDKLTDEKSRFHPSVHTVYHGVDIGLFQNALRQPGGSRPSDLPKTSPIIGYSGVIRYMLDLDLLRTIAQQRPDWQIVLVGPVAESRPEFYSRIEELKRLPNITFTGAKSPGDLPKYIAAFDVCLLPYVTGEVSSYYSAPLKFFEYLAAGKPVVSTVGPYQYDRGVVLNCSSQQEMLLSIEEALKSSSPALEARRKAIAAGNSWEERVRLIDRVLTSEPAPGTCSSKRT